MEIDRCRRIKRIRVVLIEDHLPWNIRILVDAYCCHRSVSDPTNICSLQLSDRRGILIFLYKNKFGREIITVHQKAIGIAKMVSIIVDYLNCYRNGAEKSRRVHADHTRGESSDRVLL